MSSDRDPNKSQASPGSGDSQASITEVVRDLLLAHLEPPNDPDAPLDLPSLALVSLAEELEQEFNFIVAARDLTAENFATSGKIVAYVDRRRSRG